MPSRLAPPLLLALLVLLAGCNAFSGQPGPAEPTPDSTTTPAANTTTTTATATTMPRAGPSLVIESRVAALPVHVAIYNSTFVSGDPVFEQTATLDGDEELYLTPEIATLDAAHVVVTANGTAVWNASLRLSKGYRVRVNETDSTVMVSEA